MSTQMQAYRLQEFGTLDGIALGEIPVPEPGSGEVVVRINARSLNFRDLLILRQRYPIAAQKGVVPLSDGAGEVVAVGERVTRVAVGDHVAAIYFPRWRDGRLEFELAVEQFGCTRDGMLAEFVLAHEQALVKVPQHLTFNEAATLPCAALTAWSALTGPRPILPGETVLTIGTGGVAFFALQFAKIFGARVISITSSIKKAEILRRHGADQVVDYTRDVEWDRAVRELTRGRGVDHVVETGSIETLGKSLAACSQNAEVALVAALGAGTLDAAALGSRLVTIRRVFVGSRTGFETMNRAIEQHRLRPVIDYVFAFNEAKAAYAHFESKRHIGKVVVAGP